MKVLCSWCGKSIKEKKPLWDESVSHSICGECYKKVRAEVEITKALKGGMEMEILNAVQIAKREWENIRVSLMSCGEIGEFDSDGYASILGAGFVSRSMHLTQHLINMENKIPKHGYFTQEAAHVFMALASRAGEKLGLTNEMAETFGRGYAWIRTGWFDPTGMEKSSVIKQLFFFKIFFPLGGYFYWNFDSQIVKTRLYLVFYKFVTWQLNPSLYSEDVTEYREQIEPLWRGLYQAMDFPSEEFNINYKNCDEYQT